MIKIKYPAKKPAIKKEDSKEWIFCTIRKRWMVLTPEEWVRQNLLLFFIEEMKYPASLMAVEKQLLLGEMKKRFDIVLYRNDAPFMLVECKEMNVPISQKTLDQVLRYNINLQATFFIISNGADCYGFKNENGKMVEMDGFPEF
ncbi:MAG: type I restriction enzyme HsdR N-terminal domain-containing protein [Gloeobacteraceae cyanobacterium ES-bin-316]|nr:type I restriction enzyme HsdR N-terminal domain-containing protein [Ferruginibacter sp.]